MKMRGPHSNHTDDLRVKCGQQVTQQQHDLASVWRSEKTTTTTIASVVTTAATVAAAATANLQ